MPQRIKLSRARGYTLPVGAVNVARPTKWGNPHRPRDDTWAAVREVVDLYREDILCGRLPITQEMIVSELAGHDLACWCDLDRPCHADVLIEIANAPA